MGKLEIINNEVHTIEERFTIQTFAKAVGVYPQTVALWVKLDKIDLYQSPYDVIKQFWKMSGECTECGKRITANLTTERFCGHCGEPRLKIGVTYYVDQSKGDDSNDGVTTRTAFESSSKAMCRARKAKDRIVYL